MIKGLRTPKNPEFQISEQQLSLRIVKQYLPALLFSFPHFCISYIINKTFDLSHSDNELTNLHDLLNSKIDKLVLLKKRTNDFKSSTGYRYNGL